MAPDKGKRPVIGRRRRADMDSEALAGLLTSDHIELEPESKGYNPYDNPGPVPAPVED